MAAFPASPLGAENILRDVHDPVNQALRTTATATLVIPPTFDVDITHTEDSVRLGDGTNFISSTTVGSKTALDVNPLNVASNLSVHNLPLPSSSNVYTFSIPVGTKRISLKSRNTAKIKINFNTTITSSMFITVPAGTVFYQENLLTASIITLYAQSSINNDSLEILLGS